MKKQLFTLVTLLVSLSAYASPTPYSSSVNQHTMFKNLFNQLFPAQDSTELEKALAQNPFLVDVRTPAEFSGGSAKGAVNIPLDKVASQVAQFKGKTHIVVFCRSGNRSGQAKSILAQYGITNVTNGGTWQDVQTALERKKSE